jgi:two-component sensor histidine kinase
MIRVSLTRSSDERLTLEVADDGVSGANAESGTSFGSQLIQLLTVQLGGSVERDTKVGYRTLIKI